MSRKIAEEVLPRLRQRYVGRSREGRSRLIDEVCEQWDYSRKHAIKLLAGKAGWGGELGSRKGRPPIYGEAEAGVLWKIWKAAEQPCGKRLKALLRDWLPHYEAEHGKLDFRLRQKLLAISAAQMDRLLAERKVRVGHRGRSGTKPGGLLKTQIPIRTDNWDITRPGFLEADTVAHCGGSLEGDFIWSVTYCDILSGWTCNRAVWNKGAHGIVEATRCVEESLPFELLGFDTDNGSEFLNWHLLRYFQARKKAVGFTRSRPYKKNDNGHVEQKNWTHVRQLLGYERLEDPALVAPINALYRECWEPLHNYFLPSAKLEEKSREGAKLKRKHDKPQTPYERLLASPDVSTAAKERLRKEKADLNPFQLHRNLEEGLRAILHRALHSSRPTDSLHSAPDAGKTTFSSVSSLMSQRPHLPGPVPVSWTFEATGQTLSQERLEVYGSDGTAPTTVAARYLLNMALCESLYSPLQLCEVALRNSIHRELTSFVGTESWYDSSKLLLTPWAVEEVERVKATIDRRKRPIIPGQVVAELQFGFWTSIFEAHYEEIARFLPKGIKGVFRHMPRQFHNRHRIKRRLEQIRNLRNRVFHHERIIHWRDLDEQHASIIEVVGWISPELRGLAESLDRYRLIRTQGLAPWIEKLRHHWPSV